MDEPDQMKRLKGDAAKRGGSWNIPRIDQLFGWLGRWSWMATLFMLVAVGIAGQKYFGETNDPLPGQWPVRFGAFWSLATIGLLAIKEFYERQREREQETAHATTTAENVALEAEVKSLIEQLDNR